MSEKTPYERRLEMLKMARDMLVCNWETQKEVTLRNWDFMVTAAEKVNQALPKAPELPKFPTLEEIVVQAEKMNSFVSGFKNTK